MATPAFISHSVVIPFFNEGRNAPGLLAELQSVEETARAAWEYVLVDDGGTDGTGEVLSRWAENNPRCRLIRMPGNRGQAAALYAGLLQARAPFIITLDGDGQNVPADIPDLINHLCEADMIVGIRRDRNDSWLRRHMSKLANRIRSRALGDRLSDSGCALKVFRREVVPALLPIRTLYSFMPAMAVAAGFTVREHPVRHRDRKTGASSYGLRAFLWKPFMDMVGLMWYRRRCLPLSHILRPPARANPDRI